MSNILWAPPEALTTALTTELNSLGNGVMSAVSAPIDNTAGLYPSLIVDVALASLTPTGSPHVDLYVFYSYDGTNFEDQSVTQAHALATALPVTTGVGAKNVMSRELGLLPFKCVLALVNNTNVALGASGNTVKYRRFNGSIV